MIYLINNTTHIFWKGEEDNTRSLELTKLFIIMAGEVTCLSAVTDKYKNSITHNFKNKNVYQITGAAYLTSISLLFIINKISLFIVRCFNYKKLHSDLQSQHSDLQSQHSDLQSQHSDLQSQHSDLQSQHSDLQSQHSESIKRESLKNRALNSNTAELAFIKRELQTLKQTKAAADCKAQQLQRGLIRANTRIHELERGIEDHNSEPGQSIRLLNNRIRHLEKAINTLKEERKEKTATIKELEAELDQKEDRIYSLTLESNEIKEEYRLLQIVLSEEKYLSEIDTKVRLTQDLHHLALGYEEPEDIPKKVNSPPWSDEHIAFWLQNNQIRNISDLKWGENNIPSQALAQFPVSRELSREEFQEIEKIDVNGELNSYLETFKDKFNKETINKVKIWLSDIYPNSSSYDFTFEVDKAPERMKKSLQKLFYIIKKRNLDTNSIFITLDSFFDALSKCSPTWIKVSEEAAENLIVPLDLKDLLLHCIKNIKIRLIHENSSELHFSNLTINANQWHAEGLVMQIAGKEIGIPETTILKFDNASTVPLSKEQKISFALNVFLFAIKFFTKGTFIKALRNNIEMIDTEETKEQIDSYLYKYLFSDCEFSTLKWNFTQNMFFDTDENDKRTLNTLGAKALLEHIGYA